MMRKGAKNALTLTCQEVVGPNNPQQKDWMTAGTIHKIQVRKDKKESLNIKHKLNTQKSTER